MNPYIGVLRMPDQMGPVNRFRIVRQRKVQKLAVMLVAFETSFFRLLGDMNSSVADRTYEWKAGGTAASYPVLVKKTN